MKNRRIKIFAFVSAALLACGGLGYAYREAVLTAALEAGARNFGKEFLAGPLRISGAGLTGLKLSVETAEGALKTNDGMFPFLMEGFATEDPVTNFLLRKTVRLRFKALKPSGSARHGMSGELTLYNDAPGKYAFDGAVAGLGLDELRPFNSAGLEGASGEMSGAVSVRGSARAPEKVELRLESPGGGTVQARFFDIFLNFLPKSQRKEINQALKGAKTVPYKEADLSVILASPEEIKIFLHILVPDYNLNLNLNITLRLEKGASLLDLAAVLGLLEVKNK